jgi:hypothetical protein
MSYDTIYRFFHNNNEKMLLGLPVSKATLEKHFTLYVDGVYAMQDFIFGEMESIEVVNGVVSFVHNNY